VLARWVGLTIQFLSFSARSFPLKSWQWGGNGTMNSSPPKRAWCIRPSPMAADPLTYFRWHFVSLLVAMGIADSFEVVNVEYFSH
jgi:hypothetical protein